MIFRYHGRLGVSVLWLRVGSRGLVVGGKSNGFVIFDFSVRPCM